MNYNKIRQYTILLIVLFGMLFSVAYADNNTDQTQQSLQLTPIDGSSGAVSNDAISSDDNASSNQYSEENLFPATSAAQKAAFNNVARSALPMSPEEIRQLKNMMALTKQAASTPVGTPPKPVLSTQLVNLAPGALPPTVRLSQGFVTSVVFTDSTGQPWPITSYDLGNSKAFDIQWQPKSNLLMVQALSMYTYGNLAVKLQGLQTPVMLTLVPGQQVVDYRADLQIQDSLPGTNQAFSSAQGTTVNYTLLSILNGVPPENAKELMVDGGDAQAWMLNDRMYLRTKLTVLSPSWIAMMKNLDGTKAYEMAKSATVLVSRYGLPVQLKIEGLA